MIKTISFMREVAYLLTCLRPLRKCFNPAMKVLLRVHGSFSHRFILLSAKGRRWFAGPLSVPCGRQVAAAKPRCGAIRDLVAGIANSVPDKTMGASCRPQVRVIPPRKGPRLVLRRSVGGFGGSRRFFGTSRGNPVVLAPGIGRKIAAHTGGKAASFIRGISKGRSPWITFASFS